MDRLSDAMVADITFQNDFRCFLVVAVNIMDKLCSLAVNHSDEPVTTTCRCYVPFRRYLGASTASERASRQRARATRVYWRARKLRYWSSKRPITDEFR